MISKKSNIWTLLLVVLFVGAFSSCSDADEESPIHQDVTVRYPSTSCLDSQNVFTIHGVKGQKYIATLTSEGDWCSFTQYGKESQRTGTLNSKSKALFVYFGENKALTPRRAKIEVRIMTGSKEKLIRAEFEQRGHSSSAKFDRQWGEQPKYRDDEKFIYKTYFTTLSSGKEVRNYSICFDKTKRISQWVAYPLHYCYTQPYFGRADTFGYDPNNQAPTIPLDVQHDASKSYGTRPATGGGFDRGHQIPSADRQNNFKTNDMTYYSTNMMPQVGRAFNQTIWAQLEGKVRANICADTLYVVTGTYFGDNRTIRDYSGKTVGVPSHCWKVLLSTRLGNTHKTVSECDANELKCIGVWMENRQYSRDEKADDFFTSVEEIERKTGITFFQNLRPEVQREIKKQNSKLDWR